MSVGNAVTPTKYRLEMIKECKIAERHRIGRIKADRLRPEEPRFGQVRLGKAPDVPMRPHDLVPGVELVDVFLLGVANFRGDDAWCDGRGDVLCNLVLNSEDVGHFTVVAVGPQMVSGFSLDQL